MRNNKLILSFFFLVILLAMLPAGCRTEPIFTLKNHPIATVGGTPMESEVVANGIVQAGNRLGWKMTRRGPNTVLAYINSDDRQAVVLISFTQKTYSVKYLNSKNFLYDGQKIHKSYNNIALNLARSINDELNGIANKARFEKGDIYIKKYKM